MGVLNQPEVDEIRDSEVIEVESRISEMGSADIGTDIPLPAGKLDQIKARDNDPKFLVVEIEQTDLAKGTSQAEWPGSIIRSIAEQVNKKKPVGYLGHIPENEDKTAFPPVQAVWLGAVVREIGSKTVARIKGYLMPNSNARDYVELEAVDGVSVRGDATMSRKKGGGWVVKNFSLESIDFARKGRAGMPTRLVAVTSEMEGGNRVEPKDIAAIDEDELRSHAPLLVKEIERKATEPLETKVSEMEIAATAAEPKITAFDEICGKLGVGDGENPVEKLVVLMEKVEGAAKAHVQALVDKAVEKVAGKNERAQSIVKRLVGEQAIVDEFKDRGENDKDLEGEIQKRVSEMIEDDEDVKAIVSEMTDPGESTGGSHMGGRSAPKTEEKKRQSKTGGVSFSKQKIG